MKKFFVAAAGLVVATSGISLVGVGAAEAQSRGAPRGSYAESCNGTYVNQGRLYANCSDRAGQTRTSSIEISRCASGDIGNDNGLLVCAGHRGTYANNGRPGENNNRPGRPGDHNPGRPGGGLGNDSVTVYQDADFRGRSLSFQSQVPNLRNLGMNDAISAIRLGRGDWEVCSDADFRGNCQVVRNDQRDMRAIGLNDRISSLRPVRRR